MNKLKNNPIERTADQCDKQRQYLISLLNRVPKSEQQLQSKCAELLYFFYPNDWKRFVTIYNNSFRANTQGFGIVPGATDTFWLNPGGKTLYIEFKFGKSARQSEDQKAWKAILGDLGHDYAICSSEAEFWILIGFNQPCEADIDYILTK